jgi:hypothetical protein
VDAVKRWYMECTQIAIEALAASNFYTEIHEAYLDRGAFGSCCLHTEGTTTHPLNFTAHDIGTYAFLNGADGRVDTVFRELEFTARQAAQVYTPKELPECIRKELEVPNGTTNKHQFLHIIYPRADADRDSMKVDGPNKPVASVHMYLKEKYIVRIGGYDEMPTIGSRYLRWDSGPYGISPAWQALPECRQLNELQQNLDVLAEIAAFPRLLLPHDQEGEIDLRASGKSYFKDAQNRPGEWLTGGRYDIGLDRVKARQEAIKQAYHVELFQMWSAITKQMTAMEVSAREQEKIELFSPTFTLLATEMFGPILRRVFALLLRQGFFPPPPQQAVRQNYRGAWEVPDPNVRYISRLALALKSHHRAGFTRLMGMMGPMIQAKPELLDILDTDKVFRDLAYDDDLRPTWLRPVEEVDQMRQARAQAQMQQAQVEQAATLAQSGLIQPGSA